MNKNLKVYGGLLLVLFLVLGLTGCDNGANNITGDDYSVTVKIEGVESEEHIDAFSVVADNSSRTTFEEDNFDADNNSLNAELTNLQGSVDIELIVDNDEIEGSYQLARDTITVTGRDNIIFVVEWQQSGDDEDNDGHEGDDEDEGDNDLDSNQYLLTGNFAQSGPEGQVAAQSDVEAVAQVVLIYSRDYEIHDVEEDGTFEIAMERGEPGGMAFVDEDGNFIGHLKLDEGLDSIPSQSLDDETRLVDLGEIDEDGEPENDPIGNEYDISDNDLASMAVADTFFSAVAMNADFVELYTKEDEQMRIANTYFVGHTEFNSEGSVDIADIDLEIEAHRMGFSIYPGPFPDASNLRLRYPGGLEAYVLERWNLGDEYQDNSVHFPGVGSEERTGDDEEAGDDFVDSQLVIPGPGEYRLYDNSDFDIFFELPDIRETGRSHMVIPVPEVEIDEEGIVQAITWEFYSGSGRKIDNPGAIVTSNNFGIQISPKINPDGEPLDHIKNRYDLDENNNAIKNFYNINYDSSIDNIDIDIHWEDVGIIDISYYDIYGLNYMVPFDNGHVYEEETYSVSFITKGIDEDSNELSGVKINLNGREKRTNEENGYLAFDNLEKDIYEFKAEKEGFETVEGEIDLSKDYDSDNFNGYSVDWEDRDHKYLRIIVKLQKQD